MESKKFDRVTRLSADAVGRRLIVQSLVAGALAEAGLVTLANRVEAKQRKRRHGRHGKHDNPGVHLYEALAATLQGATGDCPALAQAAEAFRQAHLAEITAIGNQEAQWSAKTRLQVATKYQDRITRATASLHTLAASCRYRGTSEAAICRPLHSASVTASADPVPQPGAAQCTGSGCDCGCICPISGWECAGAFFGCVGGSEASCCWFGACADNLCTEQCPNCCNCNTSCCGC